MREAADDMRWADRALASVWERVRVTADQVGPRFPLYAEPGTGVWKSTSKGSWTGGFWAGLLWLRALASGAPRDRSAAAECTGRLAHWLDQDTATRGLIFWYGTALAAGPGGSGAAAQLREQAARACLAGYDPERGLVPWGAAFGGPRMLARADAVPGLVPLLAGWSDAGRAAAYGHLTRQLELSLAEHPPRPAWAAAKDGSWTACPEPAPGWSRTVPWLLLGLADGVHWLGAGGLWAAAEQLAAPRLVAGVPLVPDAQDGNAQGGNAPPAGNARQTGNARLHGHDAGPLDTSAAAIEAVALLKLAALTRAAGPDSTAGIGRTGEAVGTADGADAPTRRARRILYRLCSRHLTAGGALTAGCYDAGRGLAPRHELIWGDFFLAFGLAILTGLTEPFTT
ncbi:sugar ABC transporter permease [Streptomyces caniferus]|uniref:sugar ABC transporter permease n=1 Tax=Streptomyces caniferus TaxID=285557 RepID=UPI002E2C89F8|nr:sugar ABC transporter permease [Streptomyces caniferus]